MAPYPRTPFWQESNIVKVTDYSYEIINRALRLIWERRENPMNEIGIIQPRFPANLLLGDIIVIGTKIGNGVEVGEIKEIEKSVDNIVITVQAPEDPWQEDFIEWIGKSGQGLFVFGQDEFNGRKPARRLGIELSLGKREPIPEPDPNPPFTNVPNFFPNFHIPLDGNGDGKITEKEATDFVIEARRRIDGAGLTFAKLAEKIPQKLKVNKLEVDGMRWGGRTTQFNGVAAKVSLVGGTSIVYLEQIEFPGVSINSYVDVDRMRFAELVQDYDIIAQVRGIGVPEFSDYLNALPQAPWPTSEKYMSVIDKRSESVVLNGEKIASIRKVKKCGKCYYKIEIEDSGVVPSMRDGYFKECLLTVREEYPNRV
jgi:hypothetical protein